jgi:hypothetical protein
MRRRSVFRALLGTVGTSVLAGCNALSDANETAPESASPSADRSRPTSSRTPAESSASGPTEREPYRVDGAPRLDRPRGIQLRNLGSTARFLTAVVTHEGTEVFAGSTAVPAGETASFPALLGSEGQYGVLVETADGDRRQYAWDLRADLDDLWVDLTPDIDFRRPVLCFTDCPFVTLDENGTVTYDVPTDVGVREALGRAPALAIDNDTTGSKRATLRVWSGGDRRFATTYDLPPDVRALVPVFPASRRYVIILRTDDGEATYDWQPSVRHTLYASLGGGPTFRCGYADHDLVVRNETAVARAVRVRVYTGTAAEDNENQTGDGRERETTLFARTLELDPDEVRRVPSAVDPAGPFKFTVETDGETEQYNWVRCAPNGPIVVTVSDRGVSVSVRPTGGST